jgi:Tfp pilus assembly protein PilF
MFKKAEEAYVEALRLQPQFVPAYVNYSNFLLNQKRSKEAFDVLEQGIKNIPNMAILYHAMGLWYVRNKAADKAEKALKKSMELAPDNARFAYVYAISLGEKEPKRAIEILEKAYTTHNGDLQIVSGLAYYYKKIGELEKAKVYENKLKALQNFSVR